MNRLIIEARLNEYATRNRNKNVPWLPAEIAADAAECFEAGASIVHFHGRDANGDPDNRFETCRDTILAVREASPVLLHPSLGYTTVATSFEERFAHIRQLATDRGTRPDFIPLDMGSVNVDLYDERKPAFRTLGNVYVNRTDTLIESARQIRNVGIKPALVAWNISFMRQIEAFSEMSLLDEPLFISLVLTDKILIAGHPGTPEGLDAYLTFLPRNRQTVWAVTYIGGDLILLMDKIILSGGHIQIGLGDYPHVEEGCPTNAQLIARVVERARMLGRPVASPVDARQMLRLSKL